MRASDAPRYRNREVIKEAKEANYLRHINTWFLRGGQTSVLKVQATLNGQLAEAVRAKIKNLLAPDGGKTLVVEAAGRPITAGLTNPDPGLAKGCPHRDKCPVVPEQRCTGAKHGPGIVHIIHH